MVKVAIAGGSGQLGRTIAEVAVADGSHDAVILSRKAKSNTENGIDVVEVDYSDVESLTAMLQQNNVHTVICTLSTDGESLAVAQFNLIKAADASSVTKRFIPSAFLPPYPPEAAGIPSLQPHFNCLDELKKTDLEWAVVANGVFMDYFSPSLKSYLKPWTIIVDIENKSAAIPGSGNDLVTFTYSFDVAKFVVAALSLDKWPREMRVIGDTMTWNEVLRLAEEARGTKFDVAYDDVEKLQRMEITELPGHRAMYSYVSREEVQAMAIMELWMTMGVANIPGEDSLNEMFPSLKPMTMKTLMDQCWKDK
ncbi:nmrA-like family protein [Akanthomyces lecanii RCEF 1005]|uniref:NmrA-like family protein n=1 Tax=Akanthomyces lecanii RCEF 1005 TaxID=1081108 RepID=A0A168G323_CORDF|nr:nmrA-like family protein [Akanthomyces lecanii RCEF 1005]